MLPKKFNHEVDMKNCTVLDCFLISKEKYLFSILSEVSLLRCKYIAEKAFYRSTIKRFEGPNV